MLMLCYGLHDDCEKGYPRAYRTLHNTILAVCGPRSWRNGAGLSMTLSAELLSQIQNLLGNMRLRRNERVYAQLYKAEGEAVARGAVERSHYAHEQRDLCVRDLDDRATEMWAAYRRVVIDAGVRWSETLRAEILGKISADL